VSEKRTLIARYAGGESGARAGARDGSAVVVVDAFRASTTIAVLVASGARVVPVASIEHASSYAGADLRAGERESARVPGFDLGNSPTEIREAGVSPGSTVVLSTTNGTRVVEAARGAPAILTGAFVNAHAVADPLAAGAYGARFALIGCGWEGRWASEDEFAAGAILYLLRENGAELDERAERAVELYLTRPKETLRRNSAARRLKRLGYEKDLNFCLRREYRAGRPSPRRGRFRRPVVDRALWPDGQTTSGEEAGKFAKNILDRGAVRDYSEVGHGGANVTSVRASPDRRGEEVTKR
jgi:2-phosphosulfolactate phosphatase